MILSSSFSRYLESALVAVQLGLVGSSLAWGIGIQNQNPPEKRPTPPEHHTPKPPGENKPGHTLTITSTPVGARVEFNGVYMGHTPLQLSYDKSYFEGKRYFWSKYLGESVSMVTSATGCDTDTRVITRGPLNWDNGDGNVVAYYVFESTQFDVELQCGALGGGDASQAPVVRHALRHEKKPNHNTQETPAENAAQPTQEPPAEGNPEPSAATSPAQMSTVNFTSVPPGADINVDGKWMGSTPSALRLPAGEHQISIEKEGLTPWQRTMTVAAGGTVSISATLESPPKSNPPRTAPGSAPK